MSSSVGFLFLSAVISICHSWDLPKECNTAPPPLLPSPAENITSSTTPSPTAIPTPDPTHNPTQYPTTSPTESWDESCCHAINEQYHYTFGNLDSTCGALHDSLPSCHRNTATQKIETINLRNCSLIGTVPMAFRQMTELKTLDIRDNAITGQIPPYFDNYKLFTKLQRFYIANNNFVGRVPNNLFQYEVLKYIDFQQNKNLWLNLTGLNLTDSAALSDKPALNANFSFLNIGLANSTDASLYIFFEKLRFSSFSMRLSANNFSFVWQNRKSATTFHSIYATQTFDVFGNNISGEFPCNFKQTPVDFYIAFNAIADTNITCYQKKQFKVLMIYQRQSVYMNQTKCYPDFRGWATSTDHSQYCAFINGDDSPPALKECCTVTPEPTKQPTQSPDEAATNTYHWILNNIEWFILFLIFIFVIAVYQIWKQKRRKGYAGTKNEGASTEIKKIPRGAKLSTGNDKESLLYGDF